MPAEPDRSLLARTLLSLVEGGEGAGEAPAAVRRWLSRDLDDDDLIEALRRWVAEGERAPRRGPSLGEGGMGEVIEVMDPVLRRPVALKRLRQAVTPEAIARFIAEAQVTGQLEHPGIVPVHRMGVDEAGRPWFTMKRVEGQSLGQALATGQAGPLRRRLEVFLRVCDAVAFAHARGVVHRDLKPDNIMLGAFGEVLVVDWGLALLSGEGPLQTERDGARTTGHGWIAGTPAYMSPEQARGDRDAVGPRSDVYALGAILYELLCDRPPFQGSAKRVLVQVLRGPPPPPSAHAPAPRELEVVAMKALSKRPEDRYPDVLSLQAELRDWLEDRPLASVRYRWHERLGKWLQRHRAAARAGTLTALVALALLSVGLLRHLQVVADERAVAEAQRAAAEVQRGLAERARWQATRELAHSQVAVADARAADGRLLEARRLLESALETLRGLGEEGREATLALSELSRAAPGPLGAWKAHDAQVLAMTLDASGERLLTFARDGRVRLWRLPQGELLEELRVEMPPMGEAISVNFVGGEPMAAAVQEDGRVQRRRLGDGEGPLVASGLWHGTALLSTGEVRILHDDQLLFAPPEGQAALHCALPDPGLRTLSGDVEGRALLLNRQGRGAAGGLLVDPATCATRLSAKGQLVDLTAGGDALVAMSQAEVRLVGVDGAARWAVAYPYPVAAKSAGDEVLVAFRDNTLQAFDLETGARTRLLLAPEARLERIAADEAGRWWVASDNEGQVMVFARERPPPTLLPEQPLGMSRALELCGGGLVLTGSDDGRLRLWHVGARRLLREADTGLGELRDVACSPDGRRAIVSGEGGALDWDLVAWAPGRTLETRSQAMAATWTPDGEGALVAEAQGVVQAWSPSTGAAGPRWEDQPEGPWALQILRGGALLLTSGRGREAGFTSLRTLPEGELLAELPGPSREGVFRFAVSPDGRTLAAPDHDGALRLWDLDTRQELRRWQAHDGPALAAAWSADGRLLATGGFDWQVRLWDPVTGQELRAWSAHELPVMALGFEPWTGLLVSLGAEGRLHVLDPERWARQQQAAQALMQAQDDAALLAALLDRGLPRTAAPLLERGGAGARPSAWLVAALTLGDMPRALEQVKAARSAGELDSGPAEVLEAALRADLGESVSDR